MSGKSLRAKAPGRFYALLCSTIVLFIIQATAQAQSLPTYHVRQAVASGEAQFLFRMASTQTLRINILLPVRDQAGLDEFLQEVYDPSSPS